MPDTFTGHVRRIDLEPKFDFLGPNTYAHIFLVSDDGNTNLDVYTDDPRFEAVFLTALTTDMAAPAQYVEVTFEELKESGAKKVLRVATERTAG